MKVRIVGQERDGRNRLVHWAVVHCVEVEYSFVARLQPPTAFAEQDMNISSVNPIAVAHQDTLTRAQTPEQVSDRTKLVQAVKTVNDSKALGENNELTFVVDRTTHRTVTRVIDRHTQEVVMQIPSEYILRLAEQLKQSSSSG